MTKKKDWDNNNYLSKLIWLFTLLIVTDILLIFFALKEPIVVVEYQNESCDNIIDTSYTYDPTTVNWSFLNLPAKHIDNLWFNEDLYCWQIPSRPVCKYIELKNGTLIQKGECYMTYNYVIECINKSEVVGEVTR